MSKRVAKANKMSVDELRRVVDRIASRLIRLHALEAPASIIMGEAKLIERLFGKAAAREKLECSNWKRQRTKRRKQTRPA